MTGVLEFLRQHGQAEAEGVQRPSTLFSGHLEGAGPNPTVAWEARALEVDAGKMSAARGIRLLQALWAKDKHMSKLDPDSVQRMEPFLDYATVLANRDLIRQDERGDFMLVLLSGGIAVDRLQPWGERLRLAEAVPGDILGEMSLFDGGERFSACTTLTDCEVAALSAAAMDRMLSAEPTLTAGIVTMLTRRLSLRLRVVSARLSAAK